MRRNSERIAVRAVPAPCWSSRRHGSVGARDSPRTRSCRPLGIAEKRLTGLAAARSDLRARFDNLAMEDLRGDLARRRVMSPGVGSRNAPGPESAHPRESLPDRETSRTLPSSLPRPPVARNEVANLALFQLFGDCDGAVHCLAADSRQAGVRPAARARSNGAAARGKFDGPRLRDLGQQQSPEAVGPETPARSPC